MEKKIKIELDVDVKGLGCKAKNHGFGNESAKFGENKDSAKNREELSKVFSGEDFSL